MPLENYPLWRKPTHHRDMENAPEEVQWIELFYDLIHVVMVFMLGNYLSHHMTPEGLAVFALLFTAVWFAWADSSVFNSLYVSSDMTHRAIMALQIVTVMFMAASVTSIHGIGWRYFALSYAANRGITAFMYWRAMQTNTATRGAAGIMARNFWLIALVFAISAFPPQPWGFILLGLGILCVQLLYMTRNVGVAGFERMTPRGGHITERFALLLLIVIGEGFFKLVTTLAEKGFEHASWQSLINFAVSGISLFVLCWSYFDFVAHAKPRNMRSATGVAFWLGHLFLMMAAVMIGVAMSGQVKVGFLDLLPFKYAALGGGGLALYLASLLTVQQSIAPGLVHEYAKPGLRILGVALALLSVALAPVLPAICVNLLWGLALWSQVFIPITKGKRDILLGLFNKNAAK